MRTQRLLYICMSGDRFYTKQSGIFTNFFNHKRQPIRAKKSRVFHEVVCIKAIQGERMKGSYKERVCVTTMKIYLPTPISN